MNINTLILGGLLCFSLPVLAEHHEHRELGAHEHGVGTLKMVLEDAQLKVYLESPTINLLGFEHKPDTVNEKARLQSVLTQLQQDSHVIDIQGGKCQLTDAQVSNPFEEKEASSHNEHEGHVHRDFDIEYSFNCQRPKALQSIRMSLFDSFAGFHSINAQWIIHEIAGAGKFDAEQAVLKVN